MRKIVILFFAVLTIAATNVRAQDTETVDFTVILSDVLDLNVTSGDAITVTFDTPLEWTNGIDADVESGSNTTITCDATQDWDLTIDATDLTGVGFGGTMTADNVGVYCEATGNNTFAGGEVTCAYTAFASPLALPNAATMLIENGTGNAGNAADNAFTLHWQVGTMNGGMNATNMLDHVAGGDFVIDTYTTVINLTLQAN